MVDVRRARLADVPRMMPLLTGYAQRAEILLRTEDDVYRSIREWVVVETDYKIVGVGSLLIMWRDLAEIRSLVVSPAYQGCGFGRKMVELLLVEAKLLQLERVFALTRKPGFFLKAGFQLIRIERLPRKVRRDCVFCSIFNACDEVGVILSLKDVAIAGDVASSVAGNLNGSASQSFLPLNAF